MVRLWYGVDEEMAKLREMSCELGLLERADGSARLIQGETSVLCGIYGPVEVKNSRELCDRAVIDVIVKPASGNSGTAERYLENIICSISETCILTSLHPHTAISITLQVEHDAGALLSVLINVCCLALMDACVPLSCTFSALTCGRTEEGQLLVDPNSSQEDSCQSMCTCVVKGDSGDVIASHSKGNFSVYQLQESIRTLRECSKNITSFYREAISKKLSKDAKFSLLSEQKPPHP